jgi:hypothetical protein
MSIENLIQMFFVYEGNNMRPLTKEEAEATLLRLTENYKFIHS